MSEEYVWKEAKGKLMIRDTKPRHNITFNNQDGKQVGELDFNGPEMVFTGDANESAKIFLDFIANAFKQRLEQERADEREQCAKVCEGGANNATDWDSGYWDQCCNNRAAAIRARSKNEL